MPKASTKAARATRGSPRKQRGDLRCLQCPDLPFRNQCPHSPEGKLFLQLQSSKKPVRAPQRCGKCPDRPLRTQCQHTQAGHEYLRQKDIELTLTASMSAELSGHRDNPPLSETLPLQSLIDPNALLAPPNDALTPNEPPFPLLVPSALPLSNLTISGTNGDLSPPSLPSAPSGFIPINPFWSPPVMSSPANNVNLNTPTPHSSISMMSTTSTNPSTPSSSLTPLPSGSKSKKKYERPTKGNPKFGYVKRAMRGTHELNILRRHELPSPSKDSVAASKDFLEGMHRVLEKAEDVAVKTGCWLFVGAQHPGAVGGTIHYTSLRLVRDAQDDAEEFVNNYNNLMSSLLRSQRSDALDACKKLEEARQHNAKLESEVSALKDVIKEYSTCLGVE